MESHATPEPTVAMGRNAPLRTKMMVAKAKRVVHDAVKRAKIILLHFVGDVVESTAPSYLHALNAAGDNPVAPREPSLAVILTEEIADNAYIGGRNEAQEGEDEGVTCSLTNTHFCSV